MQRQNVTRWPDEETQKYAKLKNRWGTRMGQPGAAEHAIQLAMLNGISLDQLSRTALRPTLLTEEIELSSDTNDVQTMSFKNADPAVIQQVTASLVCPEYDLEGDGTGWTSTYDATKINSSLKPLKYVSGRINDGPSSSLMTGYTSLDEWTGPGEDPYLWKLQPFMRGGNSTVWQLLVKRHPRIRAEKLSVTFHTLRITDKG